MDYKDRIKERGLKINWIADKIGISRTMLSFYINKVRDMPFEIELKLKEILK